MCVCKKYFCFIYLFILSTFANHHGFSSSDAAAEDSDAAHLYYFSHKYPNEKLRLEKQQNAHLIDGLKEIKFIIHGWGESSESAYFKDITTKYLSEQTIEVDIIQVDWNVLAATPYLQASKNTIIVGDFIANFIIALQSQHTNTSTSLKVHLIGHSLGAHVAGHAGKAFLRKTGKLVARITGLDPAGPYFDTAAAEVERLTAADASFVDITHTDGNYFGMDEPVGHIDFYPNGGHRPQPGCELFHPELLTMNAKQIAFCSHTKSYQYYIKSIGIAKAMLAFKCNNYRDFKNGLCNANNAIAIIYGEQVRIQMDRKGMMGNYYFDTESEMPLPIAIPAISHLIGLNLNHSTHQ